MKQQGASRLPEPATPRTMPRHVAIIMDGNGRWAKARGLPRSAGHKAGVDAVRRTVRAAHDMGIEVLTLYSFSSENWARPRAEVAYLFTLLKRFIHKDVAELHAMGVRIRIIGSHEGLGPDIVQLLRQCEELTKDNEGLTLVVAFNYGGRQEIAHAARMLAREVAVGRLSPDEIGVEHISACMYAPDLPEPDLLIRTSNEKRLSNFLLWQAAYAELVFVEDFWPDFDGKLLRAAIEEYAGRERRFGGLVAGKARAAQA